MNALARLTPYMELGKRRMLINTFFNFQFNYCPVIWMCQSRTLNNKINRLHERCLRIIYSDKTSTFKELLEKDNSVSMHYRNIQALATEEFEKWRAIRASVGGVGGVFAWVTWVAC